MLKKMFIGSAVAGVLLFGAAAGGWWFFIREDAELATEPPEIPAALVQPTAEMGDAGAEDDPIVQGTQGARSDDAMGGRVAYEVVSASSEAAYFADEELARIGVPSTAKGATSAVTGTFYLTADGWGLDPTTESKFTVDLTTLESDEDRRDNRVQEALETSMYPTATFVVTSVSGVDSTLDLDEQQTFRMTGILELHGVQKEISWEVEARREGDVITALATTNFLYEEFGIPVPNIGGFVSVEDDVTLQMQIIAQAA